MCFLKRIGWCSWMGYGEYKTKVNPDYIKEIEMMFERMKVDRTREAVTYYTH